jgi:hypothetical protein
LEQNFPPRNQQYNEVEMVAQAYPDSGYHEAQKLAIFSQDSLASLEASTIFSTCLFGATGACK